MVRVEAVLPVAQFLGRAWSGKPVTVRLDMRGEQANTYGNVIELPPPSRYPVTGLIESYRLWRASLWHESMHQHYGLPKPISETENNATLHYITNVIEDYRIERLGVREYPGMRRELELRRAVYFNLAPKATDILDMFRHSMLYGAVKSDNVPDSVYRATAYAIDRVERGVDSPTIALQVCKILGLQPDESVSFMLLYNLKKCTVPSDKKIKQNQLEQVVKEWVEKKKEFDEKTEQEAGKSESEPETEEEEEEETEEEVEEQVEEILETDEEVEEEIQLIREEDRRIEKMRKRETAQAEGLKLPAQLNVDESEYYNQELITHLKSQLRRLRKGWKEIPASSGEFDVDSYVTRHSKVFVDEERLKVGGYRVIILVDHSASIKSYMHTYKTACIALAESLSTLNIPFAVYLFSEWGGYAEVYLIKTFEEKWTRMNARRLAQIPADGTTPLTEVYDTLEKVVYSSKGPLYFITLTDGAPDHPYTCKQMITHLKKFCRMFAVGFGNSMKEVVTLTNNLAKLGYERYVALDDIRKLPEKVLKLLGE
jgi:Mg-chelatase subunit ChlD